MVHVSSPCLLSFLIIVCFLMTSSTAWHSKALLHHDGHASRNAQNHVIHHEKVSQTPHSATTAATSRTNDMIRTIDMVHTAKGVKQESHAIREIASKKPLFLKEESRIIKNEGCERKVRRLLRKQRDMDEFVAYADYKGPMHHPPRNN